ncbi:MAG: hypothetical protein VZQ55_02000 [Ruminococcus sp.]|nr:hypothetical protein [Ruminococcus sp.]
MTNEKNEILKRKINLLKQNICWTDTVLFTDSHNISFFDYYLQKEAIEKLDIEDQLIILGSFYFKMSKMKLAELTMIPSFRALDTKIFSAKQKLRENIRALTSN